jgi:hypothetical protein
MVKKLAYFMPYSIHCLLELPNSIYVGVTMGQRHFDGAHLRVP